MDGGPRAEDFTAEWDAAIDDAGYESHEAADGPGGGVMVRLTSPRPRDAQAMLERYGTRMDAALRSRLQTKVVVQVMADEGVAA